MPPVLLRAACRAAKQCRHAPRSSHRSRFLSSLRFVLLRMDIYIPPRPSAVVFPSFQGRGLTPDIRGGLPLKMVSTSFDFDQAQFDAAREKMKACPPMEASRLDFKGAAGTSSAP